jgi:hypothetical protein
MQKYLADIEDILTYACVYVMGAMIGKVILAVAATRLGFHLF